MIPRIGFQCINHEYISYPLRFGYFCRFYHILIPNALSLVLHRSSDIYQHFTSFLKMSYLQSIWPFSFLSFPFFPSFAPWRITDLRTILYIFIFNLSGNHCLSWHQFFPFFPEFLYPLSNRLLRPSSFSESYSKNPCTQTPNSCLHVIVCWCLLYCSSLLT